MSTNSTMDTDKENEMNESSEEGDTTDKLLNGTFEGPVGKLSFSNPSTPEIPRWERTEPFCLFTLVMLLVMLHVCYC